MLNNPNVMKALANPVPYAGAPPNPTHAPPAPGASDPNAATGPAPAQDDPTGLGELTKRSTEIKSQAAELAKNLGYLCSDASLHDLVPKRVETALDKAQTALADVVSMISDAADDIAGIDPDDDGDDEDDDDDAKDGDDAKDAKGK